MLQSSIRSLKTGSLLLAALAVSTLPAFAGDTVTASSKDKNPVIEKPATEPRFYLSLMAGGEFDTGIVDFTTDGTARFGGVRTINGVVTDAPLVGHLQARNFYETHDEAVLNGRLEGGYKILPYLSVFTGFTYSHANGNSKANLGNVVDTDGAYGPVGGRYNLFAAVGQYQAYAGMAGIKLNTPRTILDLLHLPHAIQPYVSLSAGGKYLDDQYIRYYTGDPDIVHAPTHLLYQSGWVFTTEAQLGYDLQLTRNVSIILENGYGYDSYPNSGHLGDNVTGGNRSGSRLYSTVSLGAKISF